MPPPPSDESPTGPFLPPPTPADESATLPPDGADAGGATEVPAELADHPRYRVLRPLGQGGMGAVYLAEHLVMGRRVALKTIHTRLVAGPGTVARFRREVQAAAKLAHPNIVTAYDADGAGGLHFLVMEYVEGITLAEYAARKGPLSVAQACTAACQVALGLQHAHEQGLVHRDIKPQNLMLTRKGQVKILDFGLAHFVRQEGAGQDAGLTGSGVILGTADYMAPEQTSASRSVDVRADIYGLGCTLFFLLTGRVPFPGGSIIDKMYRHATEAPPSLAALRPGLPAGLAAVVERMMAKRPEDRYQTPAEAARALRSIAEAGRAPAAPVAGSAGATAVEPVPNLFEAIAEAAAAPPDSTVVARRAARAKAPGWRTPVLAAAGLLAVAAAVAVIVLAVWPHDQGHGPGPGDTTGPLAASLLSKGAKPSAADLTRTPNVLTDLTRSLEGVTDFREVHGVSLKALVSWQHDLGPDLRVTFVSSQKGTAEPRFNAVAVRERRPLAGKFFTGLKDGMNNFSQVCDAGEGYRFLVSCPYIEDGQEREAQTWVQDSPKFAGWSNNTPFTGWWGSFPFIKEKVELDRGAGFRPVYLDGITIEGRQSFRLVSGPAQGHAWKWFPANSADEIDEAPAVFRPQGWRVDYLAVYMDGSQFKFMVVAIENRERADWWCKAGLTTREFGELLDAKKREGMFPSAIASYGSLADPRYAALWVRYRPAEDSGRLPP